ncbi:MAG: hypothetical protein M1828_005073 [Chrysothrix sp. TS-e1954]|nr:MAG: hypothetical protein M1828_005073 [Chrysothrix sp. TS-e1954]
MRNFSIPDSVDTVIVGNGPSALILSYILHGHVPHYIKQHSDSFLDKKLSAVTDLLHLNAEAYEQFRSSLKYSSQALPFDTLLDAVLRPGGDTDIDVESCVEWLEEPSSVVPHIVLGDTPTTGGQWADAPVAASDQIGALSYIEQLSLPGYSFAEHWRVCKGQSPPTLIRPTRSDISEYYAAYPAAVGISDAFRHSAKVSGIRRTGDGFHIASHDISCRHLVLATGTFSINLPPPHFLSPLSSASSSDGDVLVIGSGFTAADLIISTPPDRKIIHIFNWDPARNPSPLRGCHSQAYPEYAGIYRQMKLAAGRTGVMHEPNQDKRRNKKGADLSAALPYFANRNWKVKYEGLPNARITSILETPIEPANSGTRNGDSRPWRAPSDLSPQSRDRRTDDSLSNETAKVLIGRSTLGDGLERTLGTFHYATGRRGSLAYLTSSLLQEVLPGVEDMVYKSALDFDGNEKDDSLPPLSPQVTAELSFDPHRATSLSHDWASGSHEEAQVSGRTLRDKIARSNTTEVAPCVFAIGSLTGDSLVRFAYGGCCIAAGKIMDDYTGIPRQSFVDEGPVTRDEPSPNGIPALDEVTKPDGTSISESHPKSKQSRLGRVPEHLNLRDSRHVYGRRRGDTRGHNNAQHSGSEETDRQKGLAQYEQARESLQGLTVFGTRSSHAPADSSPVTSSGALRLGSDKSKTKDKDKEGDGRNCIVC